MKKLLFVAAILISMTAGAAEKLAPSSQIVGKVIACSAVPGAESANYDDCFFTAKIEVESFISGTPLPKYILVSSPAFTKKKNNPAAKLFQTGRSLRFSLIRFDQLPEAMRQTQQVDDLLEVDLPVYFSILTELPEPIFSPAVPAAQYTPAGPPEESQMIVGPPRTAAETAAREQRIQKDLSEVSARLLDRNLHFTKMNIEYPPNIIEAKGKNIWIGDSLVPVQLINKQILGDANADFPQSPTEAIKILHRELARRNIDLIVLSVPFQWEVYLPALAKNISPEQSFSAARLRMVQHLLTEGIEVIDIGLPAARRVLEYPTIFELPRNDFHPAGGLVAIMSELAAERLTRYDLSAWQLPKNDFSLDVRDNISNARWPEGNLKYSGKIYQNPVVRFRQKPLIFPEDSPVLVLGDSFATTPWTERQGCLAAMIGYHTGVLPSIYAAFGSVMWMLPNLYQNGMTALERRKVCFFVFNPNYLNDYWMVIDRDALRRFARMETVFSLSADAAKVRLESNDQLKITDGRLVLTPGANPQKQLNFSLIFPENIADNDQEKYLQLVVHQQHAGLRCQIFGNGNRLTTITPNTASPIANALVRIPRRYQTLELRFTAEFTSDTDARISLEKIELRKSVPESQK